MATHSPTFGPAWQMLSATAARVRLDGVDGIYPDAASGATTTLYGLVTPVPVADCSVIAVVHNLSNSSSQTHVAARITAADTYYAGGWNSNSNVFEIVKHVAGVFTSLSTVAGALSVGQQKQIRLELIGTALKLYVDGVLTVSTSDAAIAGPGAAGIEYGNIAGMAAGTGIHLSQFQAVY